MSDDFSTDIMSSMKNNLISNTIEDKFSFNKLAKAIDYLNDAAEIFDKNELYDQSNEINKVLISLAVNQLISESFSIKDFISKIDTLGISKEDLKDALENSPASQIFELVKKISKIIKGEESLLDEFKQMLKENDISNPEVRDKIIEKIISSLKLVKLFV